MDRPRSRSLSPHAEYEREWGSAGTRRGTRAGGPARRRRQAYQLRVAEAEGVDPSSVPFVRPGGQSRPLNTSRFWEPSEEEEEEEEEEQVEITDHQEQVDLTSLQAERLVPRSRLYQPFVAPTAKVRPGSSSSSKAAPSRPAAEPAEVEIVSVSRGRSGASSSATGLRVLDPLKFFHPPPNCKVRPSQQPKKPERAALIPGSSVTYVWKDQRELRPVDGALYFWGDCPVIGLDYHQVLDVDRSQRPLERVTFQGDLPHLHLQAVVRLRALIEQLGVHFKIVLVSHIESSDKNERNLVTAVQRSLLPVDLVIVTRARTGTFGKLNALRALTSGQIFFADDNQSILEEFRSASHIPFQIRKPGQRAVLDWDQTSWSVSAPWVVERLEQFIRHHARESAATA